MFRPWFGPHQATIEHTRYDKCTFNGIPFCYLRNKWYSVISKVTKWDPIETCRPDVINITYLYHLRTVVLQTVHIVLFTVTQRDGLYQIPSNADQRNYEILPAEITLSTLHVMWDTHRVVFPDFLSFFVFWFQIFCVYIFFQLTR
jgi:hypothetical protein